MISRPYMSATPLSRMPQFDPRLVPVSGVDAHLPCVQAGAMTPAALGERFRSPPLWQPEVVKEGRFTDRAPAQAAVLIPLVMRGPDAGSLAVLMTERTAHLSTHSGQIAFPGGRVDECDVDATAAALREAHEEVGLEYRFVDVLGKLPVYVTGTAFVVTPVVALVHPGFALQPNAFEVADVFEVPLAFLMNPANHRRHAFDWEGVRREWFSMPFTETQDGQVRERYIWGATAGMLRNFYRFLSA